MNEITIVGNLTADPVLRMSANGRGVVRFDVAINRRRFNRETTQYDDLPHVFHRVVAFGPVAENKALRHHRWAAGSDPCRALSLPVQATGQE